MFLQQSKIFWIKLAYMTEDHVGNCYWNWATKRPVLSLKRIGKKLNILGQYKMMSDVTKKKQSNWKEFGYNWSVEHSK